MGVQTDEKPLQSWKEIAAYLERDVRTAHRWEKEAGLPIRRHTDRKQASVYAYPSELEAWRADRPTQATDEPQVSAWNRPRTWAAVAALAAATVTLFYGPILNPDAPTAEAAEGSMRMEAEWTDVAADTSSRLSPDGKFITYADWSTGELWMRDVQTGASRILTNDGDWDVSDSYVETAAVSPDSTKIASAWMNSKLGIYELRAGPVPAEGQMDNGAAVFQPPTNASSYVDVRGWLSNTKILFGYVSGLAQNAHLAVADLEQGTTKDIRALRFSDITLPSPDGRWVAVGFSDSPTAPQDIVLLAADSSTETRVVKHPADDTPVAWTADGSHLLFRSSRTSAQSLWALAVRDGRATGQPRLVANDLAPAGAVGMSPTGDLYYLKQAGSKDILEARMDFSTGRLMQQPTAVAVSAVGDNRDPVYSPDGSKLAYFCHSTRACGPIVIRELSSGEERTYKVNDLNYPIDLDWSADSASLLFKSGNDAGDSGAYRLNLQDGAIELLFTSVGNGRNFGWMNDDRAVYYRTSWGTQGPHRVHDLVTGQEREILPAGSRAGISLSPDGKRFAVLQDNRRDENLITISVMDIASGRMAQLAELPRNNSTFVTNSWTPDGKNVVFWRPSSAEGGSNHLDLWMLAADGGQPRKTELSVDYISRPSYLINVHPDGERVVFSAGGRKYEVWKLSNFLDRVTASD